MRPSPRCDSGRRGWQQPRRILLSLAAVALLSACAEQPLPKCEGQIRILNPGKWLSTENDLQSACLPGTSSFAALNPTVRS